MVTATNGQTALHLLLQVSHRPDIVVLDLMMPVMNGWELRKRMLGDPSMAAIPTIVITGDPKATQRSSSLAATAYLVNRSSPTSSSRLSPAPGGKPLGGTRNSARTVEEIRHQVPAGPARRS